MQRPTFTELGALAGLALGVWQWPLHLAGAAAAAGLLAGRQGR